ncbi:hypothetical protein Q7P37_007493 [Cladosporium fusiforme]
MFQGQWRPFFATKQRLARRYRSVAPEGLNFHRIAQKPHPEVTACEPQADYCLEAKEEDCKGKRVLEVMNGACSCLWRAAASSTSPASSLLLTSARRLGTPTSYSYNHRDFTTRLSRLNATFLEPIPLDSRHRDPQERDEMAKRKHALSTGEGVENVAGAKKPRIGTQTHQEACVIPRKEKLVEDTNALPIEEFCSRFVDQDLLSYTSKRKGADQEEAFDISLVAADWLTPGEHNASFSLVEETSRPDYESSTFGWHPRRKRKEMLEAEMKYLIVRRKDANPEIERRKCGDVDKSILGFLSCMVTHDSSPSVPVLYIYEIHLAESLRGLGLGKHLMLLADRLATNVGLEKVMLTCFLCNEKAHRFYVSHGFGKDVCSPEVRKTRNKIVPVDYVIMSKSTNAGREGSKAIRPPFLEYDGNTDTVPNLKAI